MELADIFIILMVVATGAFLLCGYPVAFTLAGTALIFAVLGIAADLIELRDILLYPDRIFGTMSNDVLLAVPLFVFMGIMLERSRVAEDLLESMSYLLRRVRGGLGISVALVGAMLAASTGIVGATVVAMGLISLPTMLRHGYDKSLASGSIAAAGTLGQIIPPSIVLILLGDVLTTEYTNVRRELGDSAIHAISVGHLFAGALLPGFGLLLLYVLYQGAVAVFQPHKAPPHGEAEEGRDLHILSSFLPAFGLIVAVLGSILAGIATPTEAASVGAVGAMFLASLRLGDGAKWPVQAGVISIILLLILNQTLDLRLGRVDVSTADQAGMVFAGLLCFLIGVAVLHSIKQILSNDVLASVVRSTAETSSMVFIILIGASLFSLVFISFGGEEAVRAVLESLPGGTAGAILAVMLVMFILGFFLDFIEITFVVVPIVAPALLLMGVDPVWLGVMMAMNLQTSFLTPPFGFALFYLRGVAPDSVRTGDIYRGVIPFVGIQIVALILLAIFPEIATWLPDQVFE
ncbi:MAG: TRAP transporter large permease subunit [Alphaproteobacteria bacterium]